MTPSLADDVRFRHLYDGNLDPLRRYCFRRLPADEVDDAVAEVFLVAWRRLSDVPDGDEARLWLYGIARNVVRNLRRSHRRQLRLASKVRRTDTRVVPARHPNLHRAPTSTDHSVHSARPFPRSGVVGRATSEQAAADLDWASCGGTRLADSRNGVLRARTTPLPFLHIGGTVHVQIYTMQTVEEALAVATIGVDHIGVTPADLGLPGEVALARAAEICAAVKGAATSVALSVDADLPTIEQMVRTVRPDVLHLCGTPGAVGPEAVADLRQVLPGLGIMQAIAVTGPDAVDVARLYEPVVDYLILDSVDVEIPGVGASGVVHDWEVSAAIVATVDVPVVLAGGLSPENVGEAIAAVTPWGVDSLTFTNRPTDDGGFRKDLIRVAQFVAASRNAVDS